MQHPMSDAFADRLAAALQHAYTLDRELRGGGMSRVFVATERALGRTVVIKVLPPDLGAGVNRGRFEREIQVAAQLQHPHLVPLLAAGEIPDLYAPGTPGPYYTMPYIDGESLRTALDRRGPLPVRDVLRILIDVAEALGYAHGRGVIHRDIKPGNILLLGNHALVTDFGVAKAISAALPHSGMTSTGIAIGTPAYMAPEQLAGDPAADHRLDLYALGLVGYELLAGASPFSESSPQATMAAQLTRVPPPVTQLRREVPAALSDALTRCLAKVPADRPASAEALLAELEAVSLTTSSQSAQSAPTVPLRAAVPRPRGRSPWLAGGALVAVAMMALYFTYSRRATDVPGPAHAVDTTMVFTPPASEAGPGAGADSVAIAATLELARQQQMLRHQPLVQRDSLARASRQQFAESMAQSLGRDRGAMIRELERNRAERRGAGADDALRAPLPPVPPPAPGVRRVALQHPSNGTGSREYTVLAPAIFDSLAHAIRSHGGFELIDTGAGTRVARGRWREVARAAGADALVTAVYYERDGRLVVTTVIYDPARGRAYKAVDSDPAPLSAPLSHIGSMAKTVAASLDSLAWQGPRR
jgi:serine/threonine-protein kinase